MARERTRRSRRRFEPLQLSEYRGVWIIALFDLPVREKNQRRAYVKFRTKLLSLGFTRLQYSVYAHYCANEDASIVQRKALRNVLPPEGQVRLVSITDKQFGSMEIYYGKDEGEPEQPLGQMLLF